MAAAAVKQLEAVLAGGALREYVYKDFGSLVTLGKRNTVGNLMGFLVGKNFFIEGMVARLMYRSLYKMHESALHGTWQTLLGAVSPGTKPSPTVKLH